MHTTVVHYIRHDKDRIYANWSVGLGLDHIDEASSVSLASINQVTDVAEHVTEYLEKNVSKILKPFME